MIHEGVKMPAGPSKRLTFIDIARTYAIFLALLAHLFIAIGVFKQLGSNSLLIKQFTRTATPMFVFMFGFMIEFVYVKRAERFGLHAVHRRLFIRSFQCYFAYALTSFAAVLGGYTAADVFFNSLLFLKNSRFGNILATYSIMLLLTPIIIRLRLKFGIKFLYGVLVALLVSYAYIHQWQSINYGILNQPLNVLLGIGTHRFGPSVYGAFSFALAGMIVASCFTKPIPENNAVNISLVIGSLAAILSVLGLILIHEDFKQAWIYFSDFTYRGANAPGYYIIGTLGSLLTITIFYFTVGSKTPIKPVQFILPVGTSSLISYTTGNLFLNLFGLQVKAMNPFVTTVFFFVGVVLITRYIDRLPFYNQLEAFMNLRFAQN